MIIVALFEFTMVCLLVLGIVTQVIAPLCTKNPLFPLFRTRKVEKKLAEAHEKVEVAEMENEINDAERQAEELRRQNSNSSG